MCTDIPGHSTLCTETTKYLAFYREVVTGSMAQEDITRALFRDLKDERYVDLEVYSAVVAAVALRAHDRVKLEVLLDQKLMWSVLSASCRQLCRGDPTYKMNPYTFSTTLAFLQ